VLESFPNRQAKFVDNLLKGMYPEGVTEHLLFLREQYLAGNIQIDQIYQEIRKDAEWTTSNEKSF